MACDTVQPLLPQLADGELSALRRWRVSRHLAHCTACAAQLDSMQTLKTALRTNLLFHAAPPALASRIGSALARELPPARIQPRPRFALATGGLAGALAGVTLTLALSDGGFGTDRTLPRDLVADHVRSLMADHLTDVRTEDRHTVKPWLSERLEISPRVRELSAHGFPLIGGRLDYVDGHRAAAVVYRRDRHIINLFAWAATGAANADPNHEVRGGFNLITWRREGVAYCAVSDLESDQLMTFAKLVAAD